MDNIKQLYVLSKYVYHDDDYIVREYDCTIYKSNEPECWAQDNEQGSWWCAEPFDNIEDVAKELEANRNADIYKCDLYGDFTPDEIAYLTKRNLLAS